MDTSSQNQRRRTVDQRSNEKNVRKEQRDVLNEAIDAYLSWRNNKSGPSHRSYEVTLLSHFQHLTDFGQTRAEGLKAALNQSPPPDVIAILKTHFQSNSTLNNHSLDTFLLEAILVQKKLFLIPAHIKQLNAKEDRHKLQKIILEQKAITEGEYAYCIGALYEKDDQSTHYLQNALPYYKIAIIKDNANAKKALLRLARGGNTKAQYLLAVYYFHRKNDLKKAVQWNLMAAEQGHRFALRYLKETVLTENLYLKLAQNYEVGTNIVSINTDLAIFFYKKAAQLSNIEAAIRLGQIYEQEIASSSSSQSISYNQYSDTRKKRLHNAFGFYEIAARKKDDTVLPNMLNIANTLNDNNLRYQLGQIYIDIFSDPLCGLSCFKTIFESEPSTSTNSEKSSQKIRSLVKKDSDNACLIGTLYQNDSNVENNIDKALTFFAMALKQDHQKAFEAVMKLATTGNSQAQYLLGFEYFHRKGNLSQAIDWCARAAELNHRAADDYITKTDFSLEYCRELIKLYQGCENVKANPNKVIFFCKKACIKGDINATIYLGKYYDPNISDVGYPEQKDTLVAFQYYESAASQKNDAALSAIIRLLENNKNNKLKIRLVNLYLDKFNNAPTGLNMLKEMADQNIKTAIKELASLTKKNAQYACYIAQCYQSDNDSENHMQTSAYYYMLAIQQEHELYYHFLSNIIDSADTTEDDLLYIAKMGFFGHKNLVENMAVAKHAFNVLLKRGNIDSTLISQAQIHCYLGLIAQKEFVITGNVLEVIKYFDLVEKAGSVDSPHISQFIQSGHLNIAQLMTIANFYLIAEEDKDRTNWPYVIACYEKASELGDQMATTWLAEFYQISHHNVKQDNHKAFQFYLRLAKWQEPDALAPLERLAEALGATEQRSLSDFYGSIFNTERATYWQKQADQINQIILK